MSGIDRREMLRRAGLAPLAGLVLSPAQAAAAHEHVAKAKAAAAHAGPAGRPGVDAPKVFDAHEWATVRLLADMVIPKDARSGGATDAGVPEFVRGDT